MVTPLRRRGFTMIELIFAIVIIGIVSLTIPVVLINNARQTENNLLHEAVLIAATKMGQTITYPWDENSVNPGTLAKAEVLDVGGGDIELNRNVTAFTTDFRVGHFIEALHRRMTPLNNSRSATPVANLGSDAGDRDDIDDIMADLPVVTTNNAEGYKHNYEVRTVVGYANDAAVYGNAIIFFNFNPGIVGNVTNLKVVETSVWREDDPIGNAGVYDDEVVTFRSFAANIGETDYYKRTY